MFATIITSIIAIFGIAWFIYDWKRTGYMRFLAGFVVYAACVIEFLSISKGYSWPKKDGEAMLILKEDIIRNYNVCPCQYHITEAFEYNEDVQKGNDLWCRFTLDDRSMYTIDIEALLKGELK